MSRGQFEGVEESTSQCAQSSAYSGLEYQQNTGHGLRGIGANLLYYSGMIAARRFVRQRLSRQAQICVLGLHRVLTDAQRHKATSLSGMSIRDVTLRRMLEYLRQKYELTSLGKMISEEYANSGKPLCLVTFDDGWEDNYTTAREILREFGVRPLIFIATGLIGSDQTFWEESLLKATREANGPELVTQLLSELDAGAKSVTPEQLIDLIKKMPHAARQPILRKYLQKGPAGDGNRMMSWVQLEKLRDDGFDFGAHTVTHPLLCYENDETVLRELSLSKQTLEERLGIPICAFAYPSGNYDQRIQELVRRSGFRFAFTCEPEWYGIKQDPLATPRFLLHEGCVTNRGEFSPAALELTLTGWRR